MGREIEREKEKHRYFYSVCHLAILSFLSYLTYNKIVTPPLPISLVGAGKRRVGLSNNNEELKKETEANRGQDGDR